MKTFSALIAFSLLLASCSVFPSSTTLEPLRPALPDLGPAPELTNQVWINAEQPLRLADLRGKVVLLEMWTFG